MAAGPCSARPGWPSSREHAIARAYERPGVVVMPATRMVPATAVPRLEPRFDTLRDRPEISACPLSGKLDSTTLTDGVSMAPRPSPTRSRPGANAHAVGVPLTNSSRPPAIIKITISQRLLSAARIPVTNSTSPTAESTAAPSVERAARIGRQGILNPATQQNDHGNHEGLEDEGCSPADRGGDDPADERAGRSADAS
jgi:hypothetical protein